MTIAEMRALGRKINAQNMAKAQVNVAPVVAPKVEVKPVVEPVRKAARNNYVIIDEAPAASVPDVEVKKEKKHRKTISSILGKVVRRKADTSDDAGTVIPEAVEEVNAPQLTREELIKSVEATIAKQSVLPPRIMKCAGCKKEFKVTSDQEMFKTGRCPECMAKSEPVKTESAYGMTVDANATTTPEVAVEAAVAAEVSVPEPVKKGKGLRVGGKKSGAADLGLDLSEVQ